MKKVSVKMFVLAGLLGLLASAASGAAEDSTESDDPLKELDKFTRTGKYENCVTLTQIDSTKVLDDQHILFEMKGRKYYLNKLPHKCSRLGFEKSFTYRLSINRLCNVDIITVIDTTSGIVGPSCGLGKFELLEMKKDTAQKEK
ncbi:hypothetical protein [Luteithermobacter gelatinilyticus]|uniref:hypothetical protein n=1 Tax=Luteithermobacter gelatinilyticus TaxID=2582913 RepID=UPI001105F4C9|nr:hypothetical protein [Luteithermobacter gelatinilyticus]